jgi:hypothetical protein
MALGVVAEELAVREFDSKGDRVKVTMSGKNACPIRPTKSG